MSTQRTRRAIGLVAVVAALAVVASLTAGGAGAGPQSPFALPRSETLYTSGTAWGPYSSFNPLRNGGLVAFAFDYRCVVFVGDNLSRLAEH